MAGSGTLWSGSRGPGNHGIRNFEFGNMNGKLHEDAAAIHANFVELKCAESTWWTTNWSRANDGDIVKMDRGCTLVKH